MGKIKTFVNEFKEFALKGNVVSMAVGIIIGGAFGALITSFTESFITPLINLICGGFMGEGFGGTFTIGDSVFTYGAFLAAVINFIIQAFVLFMIIKAMNKVMDMNKKPEAPAAPTTKVCPYCKSEISIEATRCPHCTSQLEK